MSLVLTSVTDGVGTLTLNNPDERNTLTAPMVEEIVAAVDAFEADDAVGAIVDRHPAGLLRRCQPRQPAHRRRVEPGQRVRRAS